MILRKLALLWTITLSNNIRLSSSFGVSLKTLKTAVYGSHHQHPIVQLNEDDSPFIHTSTTSSISAAPKVSFISLEKDDNNPPNLNFDERGKLLDEALGSNSTAASLLLREIDAGENGLAEDELLRLVDGSNDYADKEDSGNDLPLWTKVRILGKISRRARRASLRRVLNFADGTVDGIDGGESSRRREALVFVLRSISKAMLAGDETMTGSSGVAIWNIERYAQRERKNSAASGLEQPDPKVVENQRARLAATVEREAKAKAEQEAKARTLRIEEAAKVSRALNAELERKQRYLLETRLKIEAEAKAEKEKEVEREREAAVIAAEKAEAERKAQAIAAEKAEKERKDAAIAAEKAEAERAAAAVVAAEKAEAERKAQAIAAAEKAEKERKDAAIAAEKAEAERAVAAVVAAEKAEAERKAQAIAAEKAEKAEKERKDAAIAAEKAEVERAAAAVVAAEKAEAERKAQAIAAEKAEKERKDAAIATEKAEAEIAAAAMVAAGKAATPEKDEEVTDQDEARRTAIANSRKQPKSVEEEKVLAEYYGAMGPEERAFTILYDLGMIEKSPDPNSPEYKIDPDDPASDLYLKRG